MTTEAPPAPAAAPAPPETPPAAPAAQIPPATSAPPPAAAETPPATPAATDPPPAPKIGPDGKLAEDWYLALGDEFAAHAKDLGKHKDLRSLITELDYFRKNGVEYPAEGAPQSAVDRFRKIAGVPEAPDGYGLTAEAMQLPEGMEFDRELAEGVAAAAHQHHAPPAAVQAIAQTFNELLTKRTGEAMAAQQKAMKEAQDALVAEWRGDYQANASTVRHLTAKLAEASGIDPERLPALVNNPDFARLMLNVSTLTREDSIRAPMGFGDLRSATQKIADIKAGRDPVWSAKFNSNNEQDRMQVYEHMKRLREESAR